MSDKEEIARLRRALEFYTRKPVVDYDEQGRRRTTFVKADNSYVAEMTLAGHDLFAIEPLTDADIKHSEKVLEKLFRREDDRA